MSCSMNWLAADSFIFGDIVNIYSEGKKTAQLVIRWLCTITEANFPICCSMSTYLMFGKSLMRPAIISLIELNRLMVYCTCDSFVFCFSTNARLEWCKTWSVLTSRTAIPTRTKPGSSDSKSSDLVSSTISRLDKKCETQ